MMSEYHAVFCWGCSDAVLGCVQEQTWWNLFLRTCQLVHTPHVFWIYISDAAHPFMWQHHHSPCWTSLRSLGTSTTCVLTDASANAKQDRRWSCRWWQVPLWMTPLSCRWKAMCSFFFLSQQSDESLMQPPALQKEKVGLVWCFHSVSSVLQRV